jgi:hypothetical protein
MRLLSRLLAVLFLCLPFWVHAQLSAPAPKIPRILFLLDGSSSMSEDWIARQTRLKEASKFILSVIDSMSEANSQVQFGLRIFGHQYPAQEKYCYDTKREIAFARGNADQMGMRLESLHPYGVSPIAYALSQAAEEDFENEAKYAYSIILITDGGESCGGDMCKVANDLLQRKIFFRPYIVSLVDYAPLKDQYACLGTFLTMTKESDLGPTVNKIVDAHREGFERAKTGKVIPIFSEAVVPKTEPQKPVVVIDTIKKTGTPVVRKKTPVVFIKAAKKMTAFIIQYDLTPDPVLVTVPPFKMSKWEPVPEPVIATVRKKTPVVFLKTSHKMSAFIVQYDLTPAPVLVKVPPFKMSKWEEPAPEPVLAKKPDPVPAPITSKMTASEVPPRKRFAYVHLPAGRLRSLPSLRTLPKPQTYPVPPFVLISKPDPVVVATKTIATAPVKVIKPETPVKQEPVPFTLKVENAEATLLQVYFTDGNGRYYPSNPQVVLSNPATGKAAHKFFRTVDPEGNPDPQVIPAGTYNLSITGSDRTFLKNVEIAANKKNTIVITVSSGSLAFAYNGPGIHKPVSKYFAIVKRNFDPLPVVKQRCDTIMPYPPGNYHIEVNTLPATVYSVDLNFGTLVELPVAEPGAIQINNLNNLGKVAFFYPLGDKFVRFYTMNVPGNVDVQKVEVKPGIYEAHYAVAAGLPEKVLTFHVYSNATTELKLE